MNLLSTITKLAVFSFALIFVCSNQSVSAQEKLPRFNDYPVAQIYGGKNAPLKLDRLSRELHGEESKLLSREKVDFAGHYIVGNWSCGM